MRRPVKQLAGYLLLLGVSFIVAMVAGYTPLGSQIDEVAYDWMFRLRSPTPWNPEEIKRKGRKNRAARAAANPEA